MLPALERRVAAGVIDRDAVRASLASRLGLAKHADAFRLARRNFTARDMDNIGKQLLVTVTAAPAVCIPSRSGRSPLADCFAGRRGQEGTFDHVLVRAVTPICFGIVSAHDLHVSSRRLRLHSALRSRAGPSRRASGRTHGWRY